MLLATIAILPAALGRMVFPGGVLDFLHLPVGPLTLTGLTALFVGACLIYDRLAHGRVHSATRLGRRVPAHGASVEAVRRRHGRVARDRALADVVTGTDCASIARRSFSAD